MNVAAIIDASYIFYFLCSLKTVALWNQLKKVEIWMWNVWSVEARAIDHCSCDSHGVVIEPEKTTNFEQIFAEAFFSWSMVAELQFWKGNIWIVIYRHETFFGSKTKQTTSRNSWKIHSRNFEDLVLLQFITLLDPPHLGFVIFDCVCVFARTDRNKAYSCLMMGFLRLEHHTSQLYTLCWQKFTCKH